MTTTAYVSDTHMIRDLDNYINDNDNDNDYDSSYSTPYVSAPSSPPHQPPAFFFYSAPTSPIHLFSAAATASAAVDKSPATSDTSFEFAFDSGANSPKLGTADELFLNGQIRPINFSSDKVIKNDVVFRRLRSRSQHRRTRSMSPLRNTTPFDWLQSNQSKIAAVSNDSTAVDTAAAEGESACSSRCSSAGRNSKRWLFLKDFLRSKSEGRSNSKFWHNININISFSTAKEKEKKAKEVKVKKTKVEKRRSAHEIHYEAKRAEAEEMRKRTYLPYRQPLLGGCLGFHSKGFSAINAFATSLHPLSST